MNEDVARRFDFMEQPLVVSDIRMEQHGIGTHRLQRIADDGQFIVLDVYQIQRRFRDCLAFGRHRDHFLTGEAHHVLGEQRHVDDLLADLDTSKIGTGQDRLHAGHCNGFGDIDPLDSSVRHRASQNLCPEHVRQPDIDRVHRCARHFLLPFDSRTGNADAANLRHYRSPRSFALAEFHSRKKLFR